MKTLLLMRHAKSSHDGDGPDHERPLNERGRRDAPRMAERLAEAGLVPDRILCSTARRAVETAELFVAAAGFDEAVEFRKRLYHAPPADILDVIVECGAAANRLMVVAHNPGLEELVARLTGAAGGMPTAAVARIEIAVGGWEDVDEETRGRLVDFWKPKDE